jgi:hypothetical protein
VFLTSTYSSGRSSGYCSHSFVRTIKALKLNVGLSVGCGNDMSVISSNEVKLTSIQRLHKDVITTFCDVGPYNRIYRRIVI